jgi:hypothetical protein
VAPIVNSVRDMTELWGMAANVEGSDPSGTLRYYATAFADDRRWLRESAKTLHIAACADSSLHHEERSHVMLFTD